MDLSEELKALGGRKKRFILLRIIGVETEAARQLCGITKGTYNTWLQNETFKELYRRRADLAVEFRQEALRLMRRDNQLQAVLLEEKIVQQMAEEVKSGEYNLLRTNLAREVYSKLISDLDYQPKSLSLTWEQRIQQELGKGQPPPQIIEGGEVIDGTIISETVSSEEAEHSQSLSVSDSEQEDIQAQEEVKT